MQTYNVVPPLVPTVSQLQQTLVSIQELLVQQQQKIQELSKELSAAEVTSLDHFNRMELYFKNVSYLIVFIS